MVGHLFWHDVKHNLRPIRVLPLLLLALALINNQVNQPWFEPVAHVQGALTVHGHWLFKVIPLIAGVMGGSLANERRAGITLSILAKGVRRGEYVRAKLLSAAASSAIITTAAIVEFYIFVSILWPLDRVTYTGNDVSPGPLHQLFIENPLANDLVSVPMYIAAAAALPLIGVLAGLIVANEYVAMAATPIFTIIFAVIMRDVSDVLNPERFLDLGYDFYWGPHARWLIPFAPFLYWGVFSAIIVLLCKRIIAKKELA